MKSPHVVVVARLLVGAALILSSACSKAPPGVLTLAPAGMHPTGPYIADPNGGVAFWGNGSLQTKAYVEKGPVTITIRARGHVVDGEAPQVLVDLEGRIVGKLAIDSPIVKDFTVTANAQDTGTTVLRISFSNHVAKPNPLDGRYLFIEQVTLNQG